MNISNMVLKENMIPLSIDKLKEEMKLNKEFKSFMDSKLCELPKKCRYSVANSYYEAFKNEKVIDFISVISILFNSTILVSEQSGESLGWISYEPQNNLILNIKFGSFYPNDIKRNYLFVKEIISYMKEKYKEGKSFCWGASLDNPFTKHYINLIKEYDGYITTHGVIKNNVCFYISAFPLPQINRDDVINSTNLSDIKSVEDLKKYIYNNIYKEKLKELNNMKKSLFSFNRWDFDVKKFNEKMNTINSVYKGQKLNEGYGAGFDIHFYDIKLQNVSIDEQFKDKYGTQNAYFTADIVPSNYDWSAEHPMWSLDSRAEHYTYDAWHDAESIELDGKVKGLWTNGIQAWNNSNAKDLSEDDIKKNIASEKYDLGYSYSWGWIHSDLKEYWSIPEEGYDDDTIDESNDRNGYKDSYILSANIHFKDVDLVNGAINYAEDPEDEDEEEYEDDDEEEYLSNDDEYSFDKGAELERLHRRESKMRESEASKRADTDLQEMAIKKIERAAHKVGIDLIFGTKVGKYPCSIILDYKHQDSAVHVAPNGSFEINNIKFGSWEDDDFDVSTIPSKDIQKALLSLNESKKMKESIEWYDKLDCLEENLGAYETLMSVCKGMDSYDLKDYLDYIARNYELDEVPDTIDKSDLIDYIFDYVDGEVVSAHDFLDWITRAMNKWVLDNLLNEIMRDYDISLDSDEEFEESKKIKEANESEIERLRKELRSYDSEMQSRLLGRLHSDCEYILGVCQQDGVNPGALRHLWANDVELQIEAMRCLYNALRDKGVDLRITAEDIDNYDIELSQLDEWKKRESKFNNRNRIAEKGSYSKDECIKELEDEVDKAGEYISISKQNGNDKYIPSLEGRIAGIKDAEEKIEQIDTLYKDDLSMEYKYQDVVDRLNRKKESNELHPIPENYEIIEMPSFKRDAKRLNLTEEDISDLKQKLKSESPKARMSGGVYKFEWTPSKWNLPKGETRVLYIEVVVSNKAVLIAVYKKNEKKDLTPSEKKAIKNIAKNFRKSYNK